MLTETKIKALKPRHKPYRVRDAKGLCLLITPAGSRLWRYRYRFAGKENMIGLGGEWPFVTLKQARDRRDDARRALADGRDPAADKREAKRAEQRAASSTFTLIAGEWLSRTAQALKWTDAHQERVRRRREVHFDPWIGSKDIGEVTEEEIAACLHRITEKGLFDTARRARSEAHQVFRYARQRRLIPRNPVTDLLGPGLLPTVKAKHHAGIKDPVQLGALLRAIDAYHGGAVVRLALRLAPLVFVRPGELQGARWEEFHLDGDKPEWRIPPERMKMREQHIVPLSTQAVAILRELEPLTGPDGYLFPQARSPSRPISNMTLNAALRTMGYTAEQQTAHGFRSTASTLLNELGHDGDVIERQLAHGPRDKVRAAYNSAQHLPERRKMMQAWANYLDGLRAAKNGNVVALRAGASA